MEPYVPIFVRRPFSDTGSPTYPHFLVRGHTGPDIETKTVDNQRDKSNGIVYISHVACVCVGGGGDK